MAATSRLAAFLSSLHALIFPTSLFLVTAVLHTGLVTKRKRVRDSEGYKNLSYYERKRLSFKEKLPSLIMKKLPYDNVPMTDCFGNYLSTVSNKKAQWYVRKGLAINIVVEGRRGIQLNFIPKALQHQSGKVIVPDPKVFERQEKKNECVVCGARAAVPGPKVFGRREKTTNECVGFMRHYIVPSAYRSLFPYAFKSHLSHDVCILCPDCHVKCQSLYGKEMTVMERAALSTVSEDKRERYIVDRYLAAVRNSANAILRHSETIPPEAMEKHKSKLKEHLVKTEGGGEITAAALKRLSELEFMVNNENWKSGPVLIVEGLNNDPQRITDFVKAWRKFFVASMEPKNLAPSWSVDSSTNNHREVNIKDSIDEILSGAKLGVDKNDKVAGTRK